MVSEVQPTLLQVRVIDEASSSSTAEVGWDLAKRHCMPRLISNIHILYFQFLPFRKAAGLACVQNGPNIIESPFGLSIYLVVLQPDLCSYHLPRSCILIGKWAFLTSLMLLYDA